MPGYEYFAAVLSSKGLKASDVSKATGIRSGVFSDWKAGRYTPKADKMQKIADFLGVNVNDLMDGVQTDVQTGSYYIDEEAAQYGQAIFEDPDLRALFHVVRGIKREDLKFMIDMGKRFKETNPDG